MVSSKIKKHKCITFTLKYMLSGSLVSQTRMHLLSLVQGHPDSGAYKFWKKLHPFLF